MYHAFVDDVNDALQRAGLTKSTILLGDFQARIGTYNEIWKCVIGRHGNPAFNKNVRYLFQLCSSIKNNFFQSRVVHKTARLVQTYMAQKSLINFCILLSDLLVVRMKQESELSADHHLVCSISKNLKKGLK